MNKWFQKWQDKTSIVPQLVFQELRHSSVTLKLLLSSGDMKAIQADTGHTTGKLILDTYAKMQDENRISLIGQVSNSLYGEDKPKEGNSPGSLNEIVKTLKELKRTNPEAMI